MTAIGSETRFAPKPSVTLVELVRYFVASALALTVDSGLYAAVLRTGLPYQTAAAAGFVAGVATAYALSVNWAFRKRRISNAQVEFLVFLGIGLCGLGLTESLLWLQVGALGMGAMKAKFVAAGVVFLFNFGARKLLLFSRPSPAVATTAAVTQA